MKALGFATVQGEAARRADEGAVFWELLQSSNPAAVFSQTRPHFLQYLHL
jgi:hypothetical protein